MPWAIARQTPTYPQMGQFEQALADFNRAIAMDEKDAWAIASRGDTYRLMGSKSSAADFDRAIALESSDRYLYGRALTYRAMGRKREDIDLATPSMGRSEDRGEISRRLAQQAESGLVLLCFRRPFGGTKPYQALSLPVSRTQARSAMEDLNDYLQLFPADDTSVAGDRSSM